MERENCRTRAAPFDSRSKRHFPSPFWLKNDPSRSGRPGKRARNNMKSLCPPFDGLAPTSRNHTVAKRNRLRLSAVDRRAQGIKLGASLLQDAVNRAVAVSRNASVRALLVHALHDRAKQFYAHAASDDADAEIVRSKNRTGKPVTRFPENSC